MSLLSYHGIVRGAGLLTLVAVGIVFTGCANRGPSAGKQAHVEASAAPLLLHRTVTIVSTNPVIFVSGEVKQPGRLMWTDGLTLAQAIQMAGGFTDFAHRPRIELRHSDGSVELFGYAAIRKGHTNDPVLQPDDQVFVPKKFYLPREAWPFIRVFL